MGIVLTLYCALLIKFFFYQPTMSRQIVIESAVRHHRYPFDQNDMNSENLSFQLIDYLAMFNLQMVCHSASGVPCLITSWLLFLRYDFSSDRVVHDSYQSAAFHNPLPMYRTGCDALLKCSMMYQTGHLHRTRGGRRMGFLFQLMIVQVDVLVYYFPRVEQNLDQPWHSVIFRSTLSDRRSRRWSVNGLTSTLCAHTEYKDLSIPIRFLFKIICGY